MKKTLLLLAFAALAGCPAAFGAAIFADSFNYPNGDLIGQGAWTITGTSTVSPIQVANGRVPLLTTGQDVNGAFASPVTNADGSKFYIGLTINVSAAQSAGDYFLHVSPNAGNSTAFFERLFIRSSGTGFQLGYLETSGTGATSYGVTDLAFNTDYRVVVAYNAVAGETNDTASVFVNPTNLSIEASNTPYLTDTWTTTSAETNVVGTVNLRQGTATSAPTLTVDNLVVSRIFGDVAPVPEPSPFALGAAGLLAVLALKRRNRVS